MARKLSKQTAKLLDEYASAVSDHREWNNEHQVKRTRSALVQRLIQLEASEAWRKRHRKHWGGDVHAGST